MRYGGMLPYMYFEDAETALERLARMFEFTERLRFLDLRWSPCVGSTRTWRRSCRALWVS
jgi:hypothetical protein